MDSFNPPKEAAAKDVADVPSGNTQPAATTLPQQTFLQVRANLRNRSREMIMAKLRQIPTAFPGIEKQIKVSIALENMDYITQKDANVITNT